MEVGQDSIDKSFQIPAEKKSKPKPQISQIKKPYLKASMNSIAWLAPKLARINLIRDHYEEFYETQREFDLTPIDENAREAIEDPDYRNGMIEYNKAAAEILDPIWEKEYLGYKN